MRADFGAEDFTKELARAVGHQVLLGEIAGGVHQRHDLDNAFDLVQVAHRSVQGTHQVDRDRTRCRFALLGGGVFAQLADPGLAVFFGDVAAQEHELAGLHKGHVGRCRNGNRWQGDLECGEFVVNAHGKSLRFTSKKCIWRSWNDRL